MESREIIEDICSIYDDFSIVKNLRMHMYRVASVAELIYDNLIEKKINKDDLIATTLIHDLGNTVKFVFNENVEKAYGNSADIQYLKDLKEKTIKRYGTDNAYAVTEMMAKEIKVKKKILLTLNKVHSTKKQELIESDDLEAMIYNYSDLRVGLYGVLSLKERLEDLIKRYGKKKNKNLGSLEPKYTFMMEQKIMENLKITKEDINDKSIKPYLDKYLEKDAKCR